MLSKQPLDTYVNQPISLYLIYALDITISVCLVNIEMNVALKSSYSSISAIKLTSCNQPLSKIM